MVRVCEGVGTLIPRRPLTLSQNKLALEVKLVEGLPTVPFQNATRVATPLPVNTDSPVGILFQVNVPEFVVVK